MPKYFCPFCSVTLQNSSYRLRRTHNNGKKHKLMKKAYYLEALEDSSVKKDIFSKIDRTHVVRKAFYMPRLKHIPIVPAMPKNITVFKLPDDFNFEDKRNYNMRLCDVKRIMDGHYY